MQLKFGYLFPLVSVVSALVGHAASVPTKRQYVVPSHGSIVAPSGNASIVPGAIFDFDFDSINYCESGYEPITVWLLEQEPTDADVTSDGVFPNGTYLYNFGEWLIPNFGLPAEQTPPPPPSTLTMPDFSTAAFGGLIFSNATLYLAVIETYMDCPGYVAKEYGLSSTPIIYNPIPSA
ncbi:uncharacterized protein FIBRA_07775 [Fibroporia radiculosa]|uniref:Ubiquitin 3 binding protein But2 C-terminal domain-containing protein n=1 Tax=Fibroporia radiculosa TaxID=599839 RepID=J4GFI4_9APHY|nr:uncharacterized protein FIBRA_07775 [Fibroporia radiculosa]CCM05548.1 predicted protein [Fibroporia radiculosa]